MTSGTISEFRKLIFDRLLPIPAFPKFYSLSSQQPNIISLFSTKFPSGYLPRFQSRSARSNPAPKIPHLCKKGGKHYDSVGDQKSAEFREFCWKSKESRIERGSVCGNFESKNPNLRKGFDVLSEGMWVRKITRRELNRRLELLKRRFSTVCLFKPILRATAHV